MICENRTAWIQFGTSNYGGRPCYSADGTAPLGMLREIEGYVDNPSVFVRNPTTRRLVPFYGVVSANDPFCYFDKTAIIY